MSDPANEGLPPVTEEQYEQLVRMFPGCAIDVFSGVDIMTIRVDRQHMNHTNGSAT